MIIVTKLKIFFIFFNLPQHIAGVQKAYEEQTIYGRW